VRNRAVKIATIMLVFALTATFFLFSAATVWAQDEQPDTGEEREVPQELEDKVREFKETAAGLREYGTLLKSDVREFKAAARDLRQKARSLSRDERWDLIDEISAARDEYLGTVEEKTEAARETAAAMKGALAAAREAWEGDDLDGALSSLDEAIARAGELKDRLDEVHRQFLEIIEVLQQLDEEAGTTTAPAYSWTA